MALLDGHFRQTKTIADADGNHKRQSMWTHADSVELSNGLTLDESEVYLIQAEYDSLGDEKYKNNIKYFLTDAGKIYINGIEYSGNGASTASQLLYDTETYKSTKEVIDSKQDSSTAINTTNIIEQSVKYAESAGSANAVAWDNVSGKPSTYTPETHSHNYAGSSSAGGAATSANKLNTNAGDSNTPVYFSNGVPVACTSLDLNTTGNAATASKLGTSTVGSATKPVYLSSGTATACSTYAGGTAVTLNGTSKATSTASLYAPTSAGTSGYILKSSGSGAPTWLQTLPIANGGTGATTAAKALTNLGLTATATELNYCDGVTSNIQTQLNNKAASSHNHSNNVLCPEGISLGIDDSEYGYLDVYQGKTIYASIYPTLENSIRTLNVRCGQSKDEGMFYVYACKGTALSGALHVNGAVGATAFNNNSSIRYKENIDDLSDEEAKKILDIDVHTYDYIEKAKGTDCVGFIAEEIEELEMEYPLCRNENGEPDALDYSKFVPYLVKMIQIQQKEIEELKEKLA